MNTSVMEELEEKILSTDKFTQSKYESVFSFAYFGEPWNRIVTGENTKVNILEVKTDLVDEREVISFRKLTEMTEHQGRVYDIVEWNEKRGIFLTTSFDKKIFSFEFLPESPFCRKVKEFVLEEGITDYPLRILKLPVPSGSDHHHPNIDRFVVSYSSRSSLVVFSYSENRIVRKIENVTSGGYWWSTPLVLSKKYPHSFYFDSRDGSGTTKLVDFESGKVTKQFSKHKDIRTARSIEVFSNSLNQEILVVGGVSKDICFYNTYLDEEDPNFFKILKLEDTVTYVTVYSFSVISSSRNNKKYLLVGCQTGVTCIFDITSDEFGEYRRIWNSEDHQNNASKPVYERKIMEVSKEKSEKRIRFIVAEGNSVMVSDLYGLDYDYSDSMGQESMDLQERVSFVFDLHDVFDDIFFKLFSVRLEGNGTTFRIPKVLFLV